jgi:hypothetical protein
MFWHAALEYRAIFCHSRPTDRAGPIGGTKDGDILI